jgi:TfoX/Sxy family transcriptional regulator of competence genes
VAYDEDLAARIRQHLAGTDGLREQKMFGGIAFMTRGHMTVGVSADTLMVRLGPDLGDAALDEPHTQPMTFTGKPMKSMVIVEPAGVAADADLHAWIDRARAFVATLPPKA